MATGTAIGQRDVAHLEHRNHTNIGLSNHKNHYREGVRVANWVEEEYGDHLASREGGAPQLEGSTVATTSYTQPPPGAHLTHRGVRSDTTGSCVPAEMLFYHGKEYEKTNFATLNELVLSEPTESKPNVNAVLADPNPAAKPSTYKVLPAAPKANWQTTYSTELKDVSAQAEKAAHGRSQLFTKEFDHGTLFPQNNPFRDQ